ncbi:MAG TPA: hypothetical protein VG028_18120 [Terriglobia bacterium]|nr:hypothetical protein [Terriglobia bacterium]
MGSARTLFESLDALPGMPTHPLAEGTQGGVEPARSGLQAGRTGVVDQTKSVV